MFDSDEACVNVLKTLGDKVKLNIRPSAAGRIAAQVPDISAVETVEFKTGLLPKGMKALVVKDEKCGDDMEKPMPKTNKSGVEDLVAELVGAGVEGGGEEQPPMGDAIDSPDIEAVAEEPKDSRKPSDRHSDALMKNLVQSFKDADAALNECEDPGWLELYGEVKNLFGEGIGMIKEWSGGQGFGQTEENPEGGDDTMPESGGEADAGVTDGEGSADDSISASEEKEKENPFESKSLRIARFYGRPHIPVKVAKAVASAVVSLEGDQSEENVINTVKTLRAMSVGIKTHTLHKPVESLPGTQTDETGELSSADKLKVGRMVRRFKSMGELKDESLVERLYLTGKEAGLGEDQICEHIECVVATGMTMEQAEVA